VLVGIGGRDDHDRMAAPERVLVHEQLVLRHAVDQRVLERAADRGATEAQEHRADDTDRDRRGRDG
jgi:hypothetical protein